MSFLNLATKIASNAARESLKEFQWYRKADGGHWEQWRVGHPINETKWFKIDTRSSDNTDVILSQTGAVNLQTGDVKMNQDMEKIAEEDW